MKTKNIVVITNTFGDDKAMVVKNFSDENVKEVIGKLLDIKTEDLKCGSSSMGGGIYEVTKNYRGLKAELKKIEGLRNQGTDILVKVSYATLYE